MLGDSNPTKSRLEKCGGTKVRDPFGEKMEDFISDLDLLDVPLKNGKYTWSNKRARVGHIAERLDIFLVSSLFIQQNILPASFSLPLVVFDLKPIVLTLTQHENLIPIRFCFNLHWLQDGKLIELIKTI